MEKIDVVKHILRNSSQGNFFKSSGGFAWAPSNVALCKYWGKRDPELNLPVTSSLSISLGNKGSSTLIKQEGDTDRYILNGTFVATESKFFKRLKKFLDLFRPEGAHYLIEIDTNVPIASGFASSACGFASMVLALNNLYNWQLNKKDLSILARLGSGSACRSLSDGFVEWQAGDDYNGMDSFGTKLNHVWPELRLGMLMISREEKPIPSREAMEHTLKTSPLYTMWPKQVEEDLYKIKLALERKDFISLGETTENNSMIMHTTMSAANPPISYSLPGTLEAMVMVKELRACGLPLYFTQDAGPNLQLLFLSKHEREVLRSFPNLEVIMPFPDSNSSNVTWVDENDVEIGSGEKLATHIQGQLHRAFSVVVLRERDGSLEMLLQKRSAIKYHSAGLWSNACCSHPKPGENVTAAGEKRLKEEMGFTTSLKEIGKFHYIAEFPDDGLIENELDYILVGFSNQDEFSFNPAEVQDYRWMKVSDLISNIKENPDQYTIWLPQVVDLIAEHSSDKLKIESLRKTLYILGDS